MAGGVVLQLERCDAFRKPARMAALMQVMQCDAWPATADTTYPPRDRLLAALAAAQSVVTESVAAQAQREGLGGKDIGRQIQAARVQAVAGALGV